MRKHKFIWIIIFALMAICFICILVKSFIAVHVYPEVTACVNLMFKLNPLGENVVFGKVEALEADMQSSLLICTDELKVIGEDFIRCVSKVSLSIYILIFVSLLGIYIKRDRVKLMKTKYVWLMSITLSVFIFIIWMFQTYDVSDKIYSPDKQYSFTLSKYNYNKIYKAIPYVSDFHTWKEVEYKVRLCDELKQKT